MCLWVSVVPSNYFLGSEGIFLAAALSAGVDAERYTVQRIFSARHKEKATICLGNNSKKKDVSLEILYLEPMLRMF